jgi:hypothetical protein
VWYGKGYLTSVSVSGEKDNSSTYSLNFKGIGELSQIIY